MRNQRTNTSCKESREQNLPIVQMHLVDQDNTTTNADSCPNRLYRSETFKSFVGNISLFLESISIRGCSRIVRAKSLFIRLLWIIFLIFTTVFLIISVRRIVYEYLLYSLNIETEERIDSATAFPSVTFCNHQPFSEKAYELWRTEKVMSPSKFNRLLRERADRLVNESRAINSSFPLNEVAHFAIVFDTIKMYYQNLDWPFPKQLGHQRNHSIYMCLMRFSGSELMLGGPGCHDSLIIMRERSDPHHFNCYTVDIDPTVSQEVDELGLIIWLGPPENFDIQYRQAFLQDVFEQAHGLRVAIHEPGQLPRLDRFGIQIEPGRMNEINFEVIKKEHQATPRKPCIRHPKDHYHDLESIYAYEFELCMETHLQRVIVAQCSCLYAYLPRIFLPTNRLPYCGRFITRNNTFDEQALFRRKQCVFEIVKQFATLRKRYESEGLCLRRCNIIDYDNRVSVTTWRATQWQLYWSQETAAALEEVLNHMPQPADQSTGKMVSYLRTGNLSHAVYQNRSDSITGNYGFSDRHTYLLVKRKRNATVVKKETLVLTLDALVSRIGGLCSLYIGMTFSIFIEIIEFIYMAYERHRETSVNRTRKKSDIGNGPQLIKQTQSPEEEIIDVVGNGEPSDMVELQSNVQLTGYTEVNKRINAT